MPLPLVADDVVERSQTELKEKFLSGSSVPQVNVEIVRSLAAVGRFEYPAGTGNWFAVPRVPYQDGLKLKDLYLRLSLSQKDSDAGMHYAYASQLREMLDIAWKLSIPERRFMRAMKKVLRWHNPFIRLASEGDISTLLGFFLIRRMKSSVQFHSPAMDQSTLAQ